MKPNRKNLITQRAVIEKKLRPWTPLRADHVPRSGWIKAVRGALGMNTRQLAERVGVEQSSITRIEERELLGNVTLETLGRAAKAMNCKLIYAIVPDDGYGDLDAIIDERARAVAQQLVRRAEHSMRLEKQGAEEDELGQEVESLANELKSTADSRIWWRRIGVESAETQK